MAISINGNFLNFNFVYSNKSTIKSYMLHTIAGQRKIGLSYTPSIDMRQNKWSFSSFIVIPDVENNFGSTLFSSVNTPNMTDYNHSTLEISTDKKIRFMVVGGGGFVYAYKTTTTLPVNTLLHLMVHYDESLPTPIKFYVNREIQSHTIPNGSYRSGVVNFGQEGYIHRIGISPQLRSMDLYIGNPIMAFSTFAFDDVTTIKNDKIYPKQTTMPSFVNFIFDDLLNAGKNNSDLNKPWNINDTLESDFVSLQNFY